MEFQVPQLDEPQDVLEDEPQVVPEYEPEVVDPEDEPEVVDPEDEPQVVPEYEPEVVEPEDEPIVVEPEDEPIVIEPEDEPQVVEPEDEPQVVPHNGPQVIELEDEDEPPEIGPQVVLDEPIVVEPDDEPQVDPQEEPPPPQVDPEDEPRTESEWVELFDEAIQTLNETMTPVFLMNHPRVHFYLEQQKMVELCRRRDFSDALTFSHKFVKWESFVWGNDSFKKDCRLTLLLMLYGDDEEYPASELLDYSRIYGIGRYVIDGMIKYQGNQRGNCIQKAVEMMVWEQYELYNLKVSFPYFDYDTGFPMRKVVEE